MRSLSPAGGVLAVVLSMTQPASAQTLERDWQSALESAVEAVNNSDWAGAEMAAKKAWNIACSLDHEPRACSLSLNCLGRVYEHQGRLAPAERCYRDALSIWERLPGSNPFGLVSILNNLSHLYLQNGRVSEGEAVLKRTVAVHLGGDPGVIVQQVNTCELMCIVAVARQRRKEAAAHARNLVALAERAYPCSHPRIAMAWNTVGLVALAFGRSAEAIAPLSKSLELAQASLGREDPRTAIIMANLGQAYARTNQLDSAEALLVAAVRLAVAPAQGIDHPSAAKVLAPYAELLRKRNRKDEAKRIEERIRSIVSAFGPSSLGQTVAVGDLRR